MALNKNIKKDLDFLIHNSKILRSYAKMLKSHYFHLRYPWLRFIPFYSISYSWKTDFWSKADILKDMEQVFKAHKIIKKQFMEQLKSMEGSV